MKILLLLLTASVVNANLFQLARMISCLEERDLVEALEYSSYGCFCGKGSAGNAPVDPSDRCCQAHDHCYEDARAESNGCSSFEVYEIFYDYTRAADDSGKCGVHCKPRDDYPASDEKAGCKSFLCECDHHLAQCLAENRGSYNVEYIGYRFKAAGKENCV